MAVLASCRVLGLLDWSAGWRVGPAGGIHHGGRSWDLRHPPSASPTPNDAGDFFFALAHLLPSSKHERINACCISAKCSPVLLLSEGKAGKTHRRWHCTRHAVTRARKGAPRRHGRRAGPSTGLLCWRVQWQLRVDPQTARRPERPGKRRARVWCRGVLAAGPISTLPARPGLGWGTPHRARTHHYGGNVIAMDPPCHT